MATLPEGRVPLTDEDMVILLHNMARNVGQRDKMLEEDLRQTADRFSQLSSKAAQRRHWCDGNE